MRKGHVQIFMKYERKLRAGQGMDILGDRAFLLFDSGMCGVYDLKKRQDEALDFFPLGSYNEGVPAREYRNHANSCMFGSLIPEGKEMPYLYVTIGSGIGTDEDGFHYRCAVEEITKTAEGAHQAKTLQIITYRPEEMGDLPWEQPAWGCPAFFADEKKKKMYILSARYRTKHGCVPEGKKNAYIVTAFDLPDLEAGTMVRLSPRDIKDQFAVESDVLFTQGGALYDDKIYYTFGCPGGGYPNHVMVFDLEKKEIICNIGDMDEGFDQEEIECCARYGEKFLCNTSTGSIYEVDIRI